MESNDIIAKTIDMSLKSDGFWARWLVHGLERADLESIRGLCTTGDKWAQHWSELAFDKENKAKQLNQTGLRSEAEQMYRKSSLYYNLAQWIYPSPTEKKRVLMKKCQNQHQLADSISLVSTKYEKLIVDGHECLGRIRVPSHPKGCVIIINPIDSSKEELYLYEKDYIEAGFATVSFDGPGQGSTFVYQKRKANNKQIKLFVDMLINYASKQFPDLRLYLFGTSTGGGCALYGSSNPRISKVVSVSPAIGFSKMHLSDYFRGRLYTYLEPNDEGIPSLVGLTYLRPVLVYHGGMDRMVPFEAIMEVYTHLAEGKELIAYPNETHCCNFKLSEIRQHSIEWFTNVT